MLKNDGLNALVDGPDLKWCENESSKASKQNKGTVLPG